jgi:hypothetical protein
LDLCTINDERIELEAGARQAAGARGHKAKADAAGMEVDELSRVAPPVISTNLFEKKRQAALSHQNIKTKNGRAKLRSELVTCLWRGVS